MKPTAARQESQPHPMRRINALALSVAALLSACGGGGSNDAGTNSSAIAAITVSADPTCGLPDFQAEVLRKINQVRSAGATCEAETDTAGNVIHPRQVYAPGGGALAWNVLLQQAAVGHSTDMAKHNYFSHTSQDGRSLSQRVDATGYQWLSLAENIAAGYPQVTAVFDGYLGKPGWMTSPGHCHNIMKPTLTEVAVACVTATGATFSNYWTMDLGTPRP